MSKVIPEQDFVDLFYCKCTTCGKPMILARELREGRYYAVCEPCHTMQPISDADEPPMSNLEGTLHT
jgi:hypothetical protein